MEKAVGYLRVSKEEEETRNQLLQIQKAFGDKFRIVKYFSDEDVSGWKVPVLKRPGFQELLNYCKEHKIVRILFYDITRFGRSWKDVISTYYALEQEGFYLHFALQPTLSREFYEQMYSVLEEPLRSFMIERTLHQDLFHYATMAEFEVVMTSMRTRAALERVKLEGRSLGRPKIPEWVRDKIIELYRQGYTYEQIRDAIVYEIRTKDGRRKKRHPSLGYISEVISSL